MPDIPQILSTQAYGTTPLPTESPDALTRAQDLFTQGMKEVSGNLAQISGRMAAAQQVAAAASYEASSAMQLTDLKEKYARDPDPSTAGARFAAEAQQWQQNTLGGIADPNTRFYVAKNLSHRIPVAYAEVSGQALSQQHTAAVGALQNATGTQSMQLANAGNEADSTLAVGALKSAIGGSVAAGTIDQPTGNKLFSQAVRQAAMIQSARDPAAAQALINRFAPEMQAGDVAEMSVHLRPQIERQQENDAAQQTLQAGSGTASGAMAIKAGWMARGYDDTTATALTARAVLESSAGQRQVNDDGTSRGIYQLTGERLAAFREQYGIDPDKATLDQQLDFADQELQTTEKPAKAAIDAAQTLGDKARAVSRSYIRPGLTEDAKTMEAERTARTAEKLATFGGQPDLPAMVADVQTRTANLPFAVQQGATAKVIEAYHRDQAGLAPARADLGRKLTDLMASYEAGATDPPIPDAAMRTLLPPQEYTRQMEALTIARQAGKYYAAVQLASPEEEQAARQALAVSGSLASQRPGMARHQVGTAADPTGAAAPEDAENARLRLAVAAKYEAMLAKKHEMLAADPAAYLHSTSPALQDLANKIDPAKPETMQAYLDAQKQMQTQMGIPPSQQRVLTNGRVADLAATIANTDPATGDTGKLGASLANLYGPYWPRAMGELVTKGKISPDFQLLADMTAPGQAGGAADFQRMLIYRERKGGAEKMAADANPDVVKDINKNIDATIDPFRETVKWNQGGLDLLNTVRDGVKQLAIYYAVRGDSASEALRKSYQSVIDEKYETSGTMLIDKTKADPGAVKSAASRMQNSLTAADLAIPPARANIPGETDADRQAAVLRSAQRGFWVPTNGTDGLQLMGQLRNGDAIPIRRLDGSPVAIKFGALPAPPPPMQPPAYTGEPFGNQ